MTTDDIGLVVFDLGGVLVRVAGSWEATLERAGVAPPPDLATRIEDGAASPIMVEYETGGADAATFARRVARVVGITEEQVRAVMDAWLVGPYDGIPELLDRLDSAGLSTACLSNTNPHHWAMMTGRSHAAVPLDRLTYRFASHLVGAMKPAGAAYAVVERETGVEPGRILFYDDRALNVRAAVARGWQALVVDPEDPIGTISRDLSRRGVP